MGIFEANAFIRLGGQVLFDIGRLFLAFAFVVWVTLGSQQSWPERAVSHAPYLMAFVVVWCVVAFDQGLFVSRRGESLTAILFSVTKVYFITLLVGGFGLALYLRGGYNRSFFAAYALTILVVMLTSVLVSRPGVLILQQRYSTRRVLLIGADQRAARLTEVFLANEHYGYHIMGFLEDDPGRRHILEQYGLKCLGNVREIEGLLVRRIIDGVYISLSLNDSYETVQQVVHLCETIGVPVRLTADMFPLDLAECDVTRIGNIPLLSFATRPAYLAGIQLRRAFELATASLLLVALSPVFLAIAILVKLESRGPILVRDSAGGRHSGRRGVFSFRVYRCTDSHEPSCSSTPLTRTGRFLRRYGLDELPQVIDVLQGRISYAGFSVSPTEANTLSDDDRNTRFPHQQYRVAPTLLLAGLDACCIMIAYFLAVRTTVPTPEVVSLSLANNLPFLFVLILTWYSAAVERRLWRWRTVEPLTPCAFGLLTAVGNAALVCGFLLAVMIPGSPSTRRFLVAFCFFAFGTLLSFRVSMRFLTRVAYLLGYNIRRVAVVGTNERSEQLVEALGEEFRFGYRVVGVFEDEADRVDSDTYAGVPYLGGVNSLKDLLARQGVDEVYMTLPVRSHFDTIRRVVDLCRSAGIPLHVVADVLPHRIAKSRAIMIQDIPLVSLSPVSENHVWLALKRLTDLIVSSVLIVACIPLFTFLAILIKLDSRGPVFFVQERIGRNHRRFRMIKFRSMVANAEELKEEVMDLNEADGPVFKIRNDPRVTRVGMYMRKYSLDELPQLFNVWFGQMSLVGPRPLLPDEVDKFEWVDRRRLSVKPGMTGLWQISGRSNIPFKKWVEMDLAYIDTWSFWQDIRILFKTFNAVVSGRGAA